MKRLLSISLAGALALWAVAAARGQANAQKTAVPDKAAQEEARKVVDEVYRTSVQAAKSQAQQLAIAEQMIKDAANTTDKPAVQFILLRSGFDLAVQAGDAERALSVVDDLDASFAVKRSALRADAILKAAKTAKSDARGSLLTKAFQVAEEAIAAEDFNLARRLYDFAATEAKARKDSALLKQATKLRDQAARLVKSHEALEESRSTLKRDPDNKPANLKVGEFRCFAQNHWAAGLPLLARGDDETLKSLADRELQTGPRTTDEQLKLADDWWTAAEKRKDDFGPALQARAARWYRLALPSTSGLTRLRAEKRLAAAPAIEAESAAAGPRGQVKQIRFDDAKTLEQFTLQGADEIEDPVEDLPRDSELWQVKEGELLLVSEGVSKSTQAALSQKYNQVFEVVVRGRIVPPNRNNFRFEIGRHRFIFNWEAHDENVLLIDSEIATRHGPGALTPGRVYTFVVRQTGPTITVTVDGKREFEFEGDLAGEFRLRAEEGATIGVSEITIDGRPAP
jgi:hypothetical protein